MNRYQEELERAKAELKAGNKPESGRQKGTQLESSNSSVPRPCKGWRPDTKGFVWPNNLQGKADEKGGMT